MAATATPAREATAGARVLSRVMRGQPILCAPSSGGEREDVGIAPARAGRHASDEGAPAMKGYKVRLGDGSEIGPMDLDSVRNWYDQGLLESTSPVLEPGTKRWTTLAQVIDLVDLRTPRRGRGVDLDDDEDYDEGPVSYVWPMRVAGVLALVAAAGAAYFWWFPRRFTPAIDPAPWREIGLGLLAIGLLLARGWGFGRRLGQLVLLLATA